MSVGRSIARYHVMAPPRAKPATPATSSRMAIAIAMGLFVLYAGWIVYDKVLPELPKLVTQFG